MCVYIYVCVCVCVCVCVFWWRSWCNGYLIILGVNGYGNSSINPRRGCLHFTTHPTILLQVDWVL